MRQAALGLLGVARELTSRDLNMLYDARMSETTKLLRALMKQLDRHQIRQRQSPNDATFVAELDQVNQNLNILMRELG